MHGRPLDLTYKEFELLRFLATHPDRVFTREQLLSEVWGYDYFGGTRTVDVHVRRLRAKLGDLESLIGTVRNVGYRFNGEDPARAAGAAAERNSAETTVWGSHDSFRGSPNSCAPQSATDAQPPFSDQSLVDLRRDPGDLVGVTAADGADRRRDLRHRVRARHRTGSRRRGHGSAPHAVLAREPSPTLAWAHGDHPGARILADVSVSPGAHPAMPLHSPLYSLAYA